jgi:peptidoglycan hydrolase-like protein with peptidoglycan-binding domain
MTPPTVRVGLLFAAMLSAGPAVAEDDDEEEKPLAKPSTEMTSDLDTYGEEEKKAADEGEPLSGDVLDEDDQLKHPIDGTVREPADGGRAELEEEADALLQKSFSQPGTHQDSGWNGTEGAEKAKVNAPEQKSLGKPVEKSAPRHVTVNDDPTAPVTLDRADRINVQRALMKLGHKLRADGKFGAQTRAAIVEFQKSKGLTASGDVDGETMSALGLKK